ncbi:MAG: FHA domain-containing protein [Planctomycetota bacterium]|nr:FHA domain-containing protein [Planctomycetota bacterium]
MGAGPSTLPRLIIVSDNGHLFYELNGKKSICFGRSPDCEVVLKDNLISRRHLIIEPTEVGYRIRDLKSHNGSYLNGDRISEEPLRSWDAARIGRTLIFFFDPKSMVGEMSGELHRESFAVGNNDVTLGNSAIDRIQESIANALDEDSAKELVEALRYEERSQQFAKMLETIRKESSPRNTPNSDLYQVLNRKVSAQEGGGDFFESITQGNYLLCAIGNVRGCGLQAAMNGVLARATVRSVMEIAKTPPEVMVTHAQKALKGILPEDAVFNLTIVRLSEQGELKATSLGAVSALLYRRFYNRGEVLRNAAEISSGAMLSFSAWMDMGDAVVLASEGVTRAKNKLGDRYSVKKIRNSVKEQSLPGTQAILDSLVMGYTSHNEDSQNHDATFAVVARLDKATQDDS